MYSAGVNRVGRHVHSSLPQHRGDSVVAPPRETSEQPRLLSETKQSHSAAAAGTLDDLSRNVYGVLGIPVDAVDVLGVLHRIEQAAANRNAFLISTPNLNFL